MIRKVSSATPAGLPLGASASEKKFKALMVDIGLMQHLCGMPIDIEYNRSDLLAIYQGAMAEQFVGQELVAGGQEELYYWTREAKSNWFFYPFIMLMLFSVAENLLREADNLHSPQRRRGRKDFLHSAEESGKSLFHLPASHRQMKSLDSAFSVSLTNHAFR